MFKKLTLLLALVAAFCFSANAAKVSYEVSFKGAGALPADWTVLDNSATTGSSWCYDKSFAAVSNTETKASKADDYFVSPAFELEAGVTYNLKTMTTSYWGMSAGNLTLKVGTSATDASTFADVQKLAPQGADENTFTTEEFTYTPAASGTYYFAFHSDMDQYGMGFILGGFAIEGGEEGGSTEGPETPVVGSRVEYSVSFNGGAASDWTTIDANADGVTYTYDGTMGDAAMSINSASSYNDYYVSPAFELTAGTAYTVKVASANPYGACSGNLSLVYGQSATDAAAFQTISALSPTNVDTYANATPQEFEVIPSVTGTYHFAFYTEGAGGYLSHYVVSFAIEGGEEGGSTEPEAPAGGAVSYDVDFGTNGLSDWTTLDNSAAPGTSWVHHTDYGFGQATIVETATNTDDYLVSPAFELAAGVEYTIKTTTGSYYGIASKTLTLEYSTDATSAASFAQVSALAPQYFDDPKQATIEEFKFTPETSGAYHFAFHLLNDKNMTSYSVFGFSIEGGENGGEPVDPEQPEPEQPEGNAFTIVENFDDASHFTASTTVPDGWLVTGSSALPAREQCGMYYTGFNANSGDYCLNSYHYAQARDQVVYTPIMNLAAGKECKIEFYVYAPAGSPANLFYNNITVKAGSAQTAEAQTIEVGAISAAVSSWTKFEFAFTPETEGEYCFSLAYTMSVPTNAGRDHGWVAIDDVVITGESAEQGGEPEEPVQPEEPVVSAFKVTENFDEVTTSLPEGWVTTGTYPFVVGTGTDYGIVAKSTPNILATVASSAYGRNEVIYTPMYKLIGGQEAKIKLSVYADGNGQVSRKNGFIVRAMDGQSADANIVASLGDVPAAIYSSWTEFEFAFTPEADGEYCFALKLQTALGMSGSVAIDDVTISGYSDVNYGGVEEEVETVAMPYSMNVADGQPADWTSIGDFAYDESGFRALYPTVYSNQSWEAVDAYYVSPAFAIEEGKTYKVTTVTSNIDESNGALTVKMGKSATDAAAFTTTLATLNPSVESVEPENIAAETFTFTAEETGVFYMAFNAAYAAYDYGFYVFSFAIEEYEEIIPVDLPYAIDFTAAANTEWRTIDNNGSLTWSYVADGFNMEKPAVSISAGYGVMEESDDYYVSPAFNLEAGKTYKVSTRVADGFNLSGGTLNLQIGTSVNNASTYSVVTDLSPVYSWDYANAADVPAIETEVTVEEDGVYHFAIYQNVAANVGWLYSLIDFAVEEVVIPVADPLYITGPGSELGDWDPANPAQFEFVDGEYVITLNEVSEFKISTVKGGWTEFNSGNLTATGVKHDATVPLTVNKDAANIVLPWAGNWTLTVSADFTTLTAYSHTVPSFPAELYMVGHDNAWDPAKPQVITGEYGVYTLKNFNFANNTIKFSKAKGGWDTFNNAGINVNGTVQLNQEVSITYGYCGDIKLPAAGYYDVTIDLVSMTVLFEGSYAANIYALGNVTPTAWTTNVGAPLDHVGDGVYVGVITVANSGNGVGEFTFVSVLSSTNGDWNTINSQPRYGAKSDKLLLKVDAETSATVDMTNNWAGGTKNWTIAPGTYTMTVDIVNSKLTVELGDKVGVEDVVVDVVEPLYFNLQGVQVANPVAGNLYIVVRGNKVTKEIVR